VAKVAANPEDPLIGRTLSGGYLIMELVGIGGMGRVYRAEQTNLSRTVAVKIIHPHLVGEENAAARFITEARAASRLNHPNSVAVIDFGKTTDGQLYLVMEFLRGRDLARVQYEEGPLAFRRIVSVLRQVLAALSEAHHLEIIHRDLKPENIILEPLRTGGDFVKVVDFGLAKVRSETVGPGITSPGIVCGTPEYMSPEQGRGDALDPRSDLYGVGVIFYQLLTGKLPFEAESPTQVVLMHITKAPTDPRLMAPERHIPNELAEVCLLALAKEPQHRFSDAEEFSEALADALQLVEAPQQPRTPAGSMVKCPSCNALNPSSQKFCGECGNAVGAAQSLRVQTLSPDVPNKLLEPDRGVQPESVRERREIPASKPPPQPKLSFPLPLVGREPEIEWLQARRIEAKGSLVGARLVGEHGVGKSRLLREFAALAREAGDVVVMTGPDPAWAEVGYYALRHAIGELAELPSDGGTSKDWPTAGAEARRGLQDVFDQRPGNGNGIGNGNGNGHANGHASAAPRLSPDERRYAAAEALRWAIRRASERHSDSGGGGGGQRRVVLLVDDLQNLDGASRNAFADTMGEPPLVPALMVVSYMPGTESSWPAMTAPSHLVAGLSPTTVNKLLVSAGSASAPSLTGGKGIAPYYVEQLLRFGGEQGGAAPARLADLIALRVERLPPHARRVLQAIAVLGDAATEGALRPLLPDNTTIPEALALLEGGGMVESGEDGYRTTHPLLREVVLATIPRQVRRGLHATAADICEELGAPLEVRALHEYHAENTFQALLHLESVGARCAARGDHAGNINARRRALELVRRELFRGELDDPMRAVLIFSRKLGEALAQGGDYTDAEGVLREALDMAGPGGQDRARVLGALAQVAHGRDRKVEAQVYLREALELARKHDVRDLVPQLEDLRRAIAP
jgi:serine/threonine-protein kinase